MGLISRVSSRTYRFLKMKLLSGVLAVAAVSAADFKTEKGVLVLGGDDFNAAVEHYDYVLAEFYAPWCGHCKSLAPEYEKAAAALAEHENIALAKIDATEHGDLAKRYGVRGYPTLKWFKKDPENALEYGGGRKEPEISNWILKKTGPPATKLADVDAATAFKDGSDVVVIGYFSKKSKDAFIAVADSIDDIPFGITKDADVAKELGLEDGGVTLFKKFDEGKNVWDGEADLAAFVKENSLAYVTEFSDKTAPKIFGGEIKKHILLFAAKSASDFSDNLEAFTSSAKAHRGKMLFVHIDCDKSDNGRILEFFGLKEEECPDVRIIEMGKTMQKFKPESEDLTEAGFNAFVAGVLDGSIVRHLMSEEVPEKNTAPVTIIVGKNFESIAKDANKAVLVEFYAPWCGHCKQLAPTWDKLGEHFKDDESIVIAKSGATLNEFDGVEAQGFPTLKYFPKGEGAAMMDYNGGRDLDSLIKFVENEGKEVAEEEEEDDEEEDIEEEEEEEEAPAKDEL